MLWAPHNPKMCVHEEYHLVLILRLSSFYVVCHVHEKFKFYNDHYSSLVEFYLPLVKKLMLSHDGGVLCFVHITNQENVNI